MAGGLGYPEGVRLEAGPWFSNGDAKVVLVSINWNYQGAPEVKGALQALYEQRRSGEAHRKRAAGLEPCGRCRGRRHPDAGALGGARVGQQFGSA